MVNGFDSFYSNLDTSLRVFTVPLPRTVPTLCASDLFIAYHISCGLLMSPTTHLLSDSLGRGSVSVLKFFLYGEDDSESRKAVPPQVR